MVKMMRRSSIEIMGSILRLGRAGKTEIMYSSNMSHAQMERYLELLVARGFLLQVSSGNPRIEYEPTPAGTDLLLSIDSLMRTLGIETEY